MGKLRDRLNDSQRSGVYRVGSDAEVRVEAPEAVPVDLDQPVFDAFAQALEFPQWFGRNWDALEDCLTEKSAIVLIRNVPPEHFGVLADVLAAAAEYWKQQGQPFFALFVDPQRQLPLPDLFREK